jgi:hypothetical protein
MSNDELSNDRKYSLMELLRDLFLALDKSDEMVMISLQVIKVYSLLVLFLHAALLKEIGLYIANVQHVLDEIGRQAQLALALSFPPLVTQDHLGLVPQALPVRFLHLAQTQINHQFTNLLPIVLSHR